MNDENQKELSALLNCNDLKSSKYMTNTMIDGMFSIIRNCRRSKTKASADAKILMQMFFLKCLSFKRLLDGVGYEQRIGNEYYALPPIIDHPTLFSIVRSLYEAFCTFELLYILPNSEEKRLVLYNLFKMQGLNERQGYYHCFGYEKQKEAEKHDIELYGQEIRNTDLYKTLTAENKNSLENHIKNCKYRITIDSNNSIRKFNWDNYGLLGIKKEVFEDLYSYLSLNSHPSFLSVLQFENAFEITKPENTYFACSATRYATAIMSFYIADFCKCFPESEDVTNDWDEMKKFFINFYNECYRTHNEILEL